MDKLITVNWLNEVDINNIGADKAKGLKRGTNVAGGKNHPLMQQIAKDLYDENKGAGDRKHLTTSTTTPVWRSTRACSRATSAAIKKDGWPLTPQKMKDGLESLRNFDANGLIAPVTVTAKDHGGGGKTRIEMWDGAKWVPQTDWFGAYDDVVWEVVKQQSAEFAKAPK